ncbi:MAG: aminotransferase class V-fold PLP-dependent enzyme [Verrucomicrobia bacterium]|nr:aminotransferase class V-fold PLP-dependent enzyme [Verrucomicrobiota bacterium]
MVSICAHKIHGPKGVGALYVKSPLQPTPLLMGGSHENEHRAGTENLAGIIGLVEALERFVQKPVFDSKKLNLLSARLIQLIERLPGVRLVGSQERRLPNTVAFVVEGSDSLPLLAGLDLEGICASSGSACSAGSLEPSHVIEAIGLGKQLANSLVRLSLGRESSLAEVECVEVILPEVVRRARSVGKPVSPR